jgi:hypothetical protein
MSSDQNIAELLERQTDRFYGKYRGLVVVNVDPLNQGRLKAVVPEILGVIPSSWALPCTPYAGTMAGLFTVPMIGTGVWIEFEAGDPSRPVWTGCWWGASQIPMNEVGMQGLFTSKVFTTDTGLQIVLNDATQTITISDKLGVNLISMKVVAGAIQVQSPTLVTLDALQIQHGRIAIHPAVLGDLLLTYLTTLVMAFNFHTHPGELAAGILPVTPMIPVPQMLPPTPILLSIKNKVE